MGTAGIFVPADVLGTVGNGVSSAARSIFANPDAYTIDPAGAIVPKFAEEEYRNVYNSVSDDLDAAATRITFKDDAGNRVADTTRWNDQANQFSDFDPSSLGGGSPGDFNPGDFNPGDFDPGGFDDFPVVLDLSGHGINITPLGSSNHFHDMAGGGLKHRTAWAGPGNGVLVLDLDGTGKVDTPRSFQFTAWDPTAKTDMEALSHVFDTNHNGMLDAGDARWSAFKILVTNPDGTTQLKMLAELGIQSIGLTSDHRETVLADGSRILGSATFTRSDGTTGAAADVSLHYDGRGYAVVQTTTHNADGSTSIDVKALNADGSLAGESVSTTSTDGLLRTLRVDSTGSGVFDRTQSDVTTIHADGSRTETLSDFDATGALTDRTQRSAPFFTAWCAAEPGP
jgi:hypothetical protein